jgi:hypothetical protein
MRMHTHALVIIYFDALLSTRSKVHADCAMPRCGSVSLLALVQVIIRLLLTVRYYTAYHNLNRPS